MHSFTHARTHSHAAGGSLGAVPAAARRRNDSGAGCNRQFIVQVSGTWECRRTLQNVLRVLWLDVFESAGWVVASAANCEHAGLPPVSTSAGRHQPEPEESKAAGAFRGECTNFILFRPVPWTGGSAHDVERGGLVSGLAPCLGAPASARNSRFACRSLTLIISACAGRAHAASSHPPGVLAAAGSDDGGKHEGGGDDGERQGGNSPRSHGLPLPEVVQRLLRENPPVLRWDPAER